MNPRSQWLKLDSRSESIWLIPTSWSGSFQIQSLGLARIKSDIFSTIMHPPRLKTFFELTQMSSDWLGYRFRNKSDGFGINFNPKLLPGRALGKGLLVPKRRRKVGWAKFAKISMGQPHPKVTEASKVCKPMYNGWKCCQWDAYRKKTLQTWKIFNCMSGHWKCSWELKRKRQSTVIEKRTNARSRSRKRCWLYLTPVRLIH